MDTAEVIQTRCVSGGFKVKILFAAELGLSDAFVQEIRNKRGHDHQGPHGEQPDDQRGANNRVGCQRQREERDERNARHAVGFKTVRRRSDGITRVVARAIRDDTGILRIIFGELENDFHQVRADVRIW